MLLLKKKKALVTFRDGDPCVTIRKVKDTSSFSIVTCPREGPVMILLS